MTPPRRGLLLVLSSPSGAGKSTLSRRLLDVESDIALSVSATTRAPRSGEIDGRDYHFVTAAVFDDLVQTDALLEWAHVHANRYGTPATPVRAALSAGSDVLFDVDVQGTKQLRSRAPADVVSIFILPPSMAELERRLRARAQDAPDVIEARLARASEEITHWDAYDYVFVNDDLDACFARIRAVLAAERLRRDRQPGLTDHIRQLTGRA